jgi:hypothetical protein
MKKSNKKERAKNSYGNRDRWKNIAVMMACGSMWLEICRVNLEAAGNKIV